MEPTKPVVEPTQPEVSPTEAKEKKPGKKK